MGLTARKDVERMMRSAGGLAVTAAAVASSAALAGMSGAGPTTGPAPIPATVPSAGADAVQPATRPFPAVPTSLLHVHDPAIVLEADTYHLFASHGGFRHFTSTDLVHWEGRGSVFASPPAWAHEVAGDRPGQWAPDAIFFAGQWHLYYSISSFGSQRSAIGLATTATLAAPEWKDAGPVIESRRGDPFNAIDPAPILDRAGQPWVAYGSFQKGIYLSKLDAKTGLRDPADGVEQHLAQRGGSTAMEAPYLFDRDGWYYLMTSWDYCCRGLKSTYRLMVGRSRELAGPYVDREGRPLLSGGGTQLLAGYGLTIGPGQASVVRRGGEVFLAHHYYDARQSGAPALQVRPLYFDAEGWPIPGEPIGEEPAGGDGPTGWAGTYQAWVNEGSERRLTLDADGTAHLSSGGQTAPGQWKEEAGRLTLRWGEGKVETFSGAGKRWFVSRRADGSVLRAVRWDQ
jgi:arabinan endo-1,5-alpha-L-arabinosidase